jgi:dTMP kinase
MIIAFVGIDGTGKTTLLNKFKQYLTESGKSVQIIKALRADSDFMLYYNKVREEYLRQCPGQNHELNIIGSYIMSFDLIRWSEEVKKMNKADEIILLDRWAICQQLFAKVWMAQSVFTNISYGMCLEPDLTYIIDSDMDLVLQRLKDRGGASEYENILGLKRLKKLYRKYAENNEKAVLITNNGDIYQPLQEIIVEYEKGGMLRNEKHY